MLRFIILFAAFFVFGFTPKEEAAQQQMSVDTARELVVGRCSRYLSNIQPRIEEMFKDHECDIAARILDDYTITQSITTLVYTIDKFLTTIPPTTNYSDEEMLKYNLHVKQFKSSTSQAEDTLSECIENKIKASQNHFICRAAAEIILESLHKEQQKQLAKSKAENKENLQRDLIQSPEKVDKILEDKCKTLLANPWYSLDPAIQDKECDIALTLSHRNAIAQKEDFIAKQKKEVKDRPYFSKNAEEAEALYHQCKSGKIDNLDECDAAVFVVSEKNIEEKKRTEYLSYYEKHPLAAKFFIRWCKDSMLIYTVKCQAADVIVKKNAGKKHKEYNEKLFEKKIESLKKDMGKVKELLQGKCKLPLEDPWYYLDETIRSEECDAAAEIAKMATEVNTK